MSSKTEDFPTPVSPTRRMVYGVFVLFFDVLIIPFLRDATLLEKIYGQDCINNVTVTYSIVEGLLWFSPPEPPGRRVTPLNAVAAWRTISLTPLEVGLGGGVGSTLESSVISASLEPGGT